MLTIIAIVFSCIAALASAQTQSSAPITKRGLVEALRLKGLTEMELIQYVEKRGVDFQLQAGDEAELTQVGAGPRLIEVVRANYRAAPKNSEPSNRPTPAAAPQVPAGPPLSKAEILTLLQTGVPSERVEKIVEVRGVSFTPSPAIASEITGAGGGRSLLGAISQKAAIEQGGGESVKTPAPAPSPEVHSAAARLRQGSKVFVAPMEGNLHGFLSTEIVKQKIPVILVSEDKDAEFIITGASLPGDNKWYNSVFGGRDKNEGNVQIVSVSTKQVVWAGEAGDRSLFWGSLRRGGERKVADRIVSKMKKDLF